MKNIYILLFLLSSLDGYSQEIESYQAIKTSQTGGRFEIVQSEISDVLTFRLDKFEGKVYILVRLPEFEQPLWLEIPKSQETKDIILNDEINYQLFLGGLSVSDCYLININTGITWVLFNNKNGKFSFKGFTTTLESNE